MSTEGGVETRGSRRPERAQVWRRPLAWLLVAVLVGGGAGLIARAVDIRPVRITSASMSPTIRYGDWIIARDLDAAGRRRIRRGEVVLFRFPLGTSGRAIKRVIALAGDRVAIAERKLTVDGRVIPIAGAPGPTARRARSVTVPRGHVFLLGDNAAASIDSRSFGPVPEEELVGRELLVIANPARWLLPVLVAVGFSACSLTLVARHRRRRSIDEGKTTVTPRE